MLLSLTIPAYLLWWRVDVPPPRTTSPAGPAWTTSPAGPAGPACTASPAGPHHQQNQHGPHHPWDVTEYTPGFLKKFSLKSQALMVSDIAAFF